MPVKDYDNLFVGKYIRSIENPDSLGFKDGKWFQSPRKVDDPNNRGFGVDIKYNNRARELTKDRKGKWLSEEEERGLRNAHIDYVMSRIKKWTPQVLKEMPSENKQAIAAGMLYRGDGIKSIIKNPVLRDKYYSGSDKEFSDAVDAFYKDKKSNHYQPERAKNHSKFMNANQTSTPFTTDWKSTEFKSKFTFDTGGFLQPKDAWDALSLKDKAEFMKDAVKQGIYNLDEIRKRYNEFAEGGSKEGEEEVNTIVPFTQKTEVVITPDIEYNQYLNTLPDNQRFTPNDRYDSYLYWKLNDRPRNFLEAVRKGMFTYDYSDNGYHANSIAFDDNTGIGYFMKPKDHDTVGYELDWFNKGLVTEEGGKQRPVTPEEAIELNEFRRNYTLTDDPNRPNFFMYQPIERANGGKIHIKPENRGKFTALKERTGHSASWFKEHGTPAQKKMATFALNARKWKHGEGGNLFYPGGEITYGKPFYLYDENGQKIDDTLNYNATIPEVVIIPDSRKTPAQRNEDERLRNRSLKDYDENKLKEFTARQILQSQKVWENSFEKQALGYAQAAATGVGIGADIVSGLPIYSSLKGASVLSRAETPMDYVEGSLWLAPLVGEAYHTAKSIVTSAVNDILTNHPALYQYPRYAIGKLKYGMDAELPTIYRKVSNLPKVENGRIVISNPNNRFAYNNGFGEESPIITNFSTDAPVRSHSAGNWDRNLTLAFPGKTLLGKNVISTQPSDTFVFGNNITVPIKDVTGFSGRQKELNYLRVNGIKSVTSPEAEVFWESGASDLKSKIAQARATNAKIFPNRGKGIVLLKPKTPRGNFSNYTNTIENLTRETFRSPTLKDYQFMDYVFKPRYTSEVTPKAGNFTFGFLNKNPIFGEWLGNSERRTYLEQPWRWENVMYDPLTPVESEFRNELNIGLKPEFKR